ncbi:LOW QUALITY PROTEIN: UDP-glycosyltransferase UGT5 [Drosophila ficusphila]|uniref:LOW QUALITY PROTEIN: UDP-glycosyltransferase UGT5 n=1 Tax=Drosophila ficusphila TaxID=30025 RepID=UPI0007E6A163|nr:LOW QUALITY PROTEIN: UDP-glycosyltransferase UGT5 [Drosophila ficusphila]
MIQFTGRRLLAKMVGNSSWLLLQVLALVAGAHGASILGLFTSLSPSHLVIQMSMARILAERGHNVTVVTTLKPPSLHKNITHILVPLEENDLQAFSVLVGGLTKKENSNSHLTMLRSVGQMSEAFSKMGSVMKHQKVRDLYEHPDNSFDLVIVGYFMNSFQLALAHKLKVPQVVALSNPPSLLGDVLGNPREVSYVPSMQLATEPGPMGFGKRVVNLLSSLGHRLFTFVLEQGNARTYREIYGDDPSLPSYGDLNKNISLVFFASHGISEGPIRPNVPAVIEVGGIQVKDRPDPLPRDIEEFLRDTPHGAILLSLGSNLKKEHLQPDTVRKMFNVVSKLKQKVVWKWDDLENTPGRSENILFLKWLPQDDILAHPNISLFITHAGKGGVTEAQYHGKPMLALPVFGDQPTNADAMQKQGFGLSQSILALEEASFLEGIQEVLGNPKYAQAVKSFSALYRDRPMSARETFVYWVEYVIRHRGAPHLQSPVVHMTYIAANNIDVYALLLVAIAAVIFISKLVFCFTLKKLKSALKKSQSNNNRKLSKKKR